MTKATIANAALVAVLADLATAVAAMIARPVHVAAVDSFTSTTPLDFSFREGSSAYQLVYAPLDKVWDGKAENFPSFVTSLHVQSQEVK